MGKVELTDAIPANKKQPPFLEAVVPKTVVLFIG
jgi:hypothetical protein